MVHISFTRVRSAICKIQAKQNVCKQFWSEFLNPNCSVNKTMTLLGSGFLLIWRAAFPRMCPLPNGYDSYFASLQNSKQLVGVGYTTRLVVREEALLVISWKTTWQPEAKQNGAGPVTQSHVFNRLQKAIGILETDSTIPTLHNAPGLRLNWAHGTYAL